MKGGAYLDLLHQLFIDHLSAGGVHYDGGEALGLGFL